MNQSTLVYYLLFLHNVLASFLVMFTVFHFVSVIFVIAFSLALRSSRWFSLARSTAASLGLCRFVANGSYLGRVLLGCNYCRKKQSDKETGVGGRLRRK